MILTIFGSTSEPGKELVNQALYNGHTVRAFGRNVFTAGFGDNPLLELVNGALFDKMQVLKVIIGSDAVLSVITGSDDGVDHTLSLGIKNIVDQMDKSGVKRIIALGHAGILKVSDANDDMLMDEQDYPPQLIPVALENFKAYKTLRESSLKWTLVCPAAIKVDPPTGDFKTVSQLLPSKFSSEVTTGDIALFMLGELQRNEYPNCRVGISK